MIYKFPLTLTFLKGTMKAMANNKNITRKILEGTMADRFDEANLYTLVDEEGVEQTFEMLDAMEVDDKQYFALMPLYDDPQEQLDSDGELVILTSEIVNGEEMMASIDDDDEYERIGNMFIDRLNAIFDDEYEDDIEDPDMEE